MRISARTDYALRALVELARQDTTVAADALAQAQGIPLKYLGSVLTDLRHHDMVSSHNGTGGGYRIKHPEAITVAEVIRITSGPLVTVRGDSLKDVVYEGAADQLLQVWTALEAVTRYVLDSVTIADLAAKNLPPDVIALGADASTDLTHLLE